MPEWLFGWLYIPIILFLLVLGARKWIPFLTSNKGKAYEDDWDRKLQRQVRVLEKVLEVCEKEKFSNSRLLLDQYQRVRNFVRHSPPPKNQNTDLAKLRQLNRRLAAAKKINKIGRLLIQNHGQHESIGATASNFWDLLGLLFGRKMREQIYDPVIAELKEDLLLAGMHRRSPAARRWIQLCFFIRTALVFLDCIRIALLRPLGRLVPVVLKAWWGLLR
jgi:hypothetical protein